MSSGLSRADLRQHIIYDLVQVVRLGPDAIPSHPAVKLFHLDQDLAADPVVGEMGGLIIEPCT
jgi:hypothetical protein